MKSQRQKICVALTVCAFTMGLTTCTKAISQDVDKLRDCSAFRLANGNVNAKRLALARYRFLKRLQHEFGLPFYSSPETSCTAVFPIGVSNRAYMLLLNAYWPSGESKSLILCYQLKDGKAKLIYKADLEMREKPPRKVVLVKSLLNFLHTRVAVVKGRISDFVKSDIAMERDYVDYTYWIVNDQLHVFSLSDVKNGHPSHEQIYYVTEDPLTKAKLKPDEFFRKYGLPVARKEL